MPTLSPFRFSPRACFGRPAGVALAALALNCFAAGQASALSITGNGFPEGSGGVSLSTITTDDLSRTTITFSWDATPFSGFVEVLTDFDFDFIYTGYSETSGDAVTGLVVEAFVGAGQERLTLGDDLCLLAANPLTGACALITGTGTSGGETGAALRPSLDTALFSLTAGRYLIGVYEDDAPLTGSASFLLAEAPPGGDGGGVGAAPLPAGLAPLLAALGLLLAVARRPRISAAVRR